MNSLAEILQHDFLRNAFLIGTLLAVIIPCIGLTVVLRRLSMIGETLAHTSLAGVTLGLLMGFNPTLCATIYCVAAAFGIEFLRKRFPQYAELAIALILSMGVGLTGVLSSFVTNAASFQSFLFGSIITVTPFELRLVIVLSAVVFSLFVLLYRELFYLAFDESAARLAGIPVGTINCLFTLLTAVTISVAARTVGALIVSSLLVIPAAAAMQLERSYRFTLIFAILFSIVTMNAGLYVSYFTETQPGGTIVLLQSALLILLMIGRGVRLSIRRK